MIERSLNAQSLRLGSGVVLWGLFVALSGKLAAATGSAPALLVWQAICLFVVPALLPLRFLLATFLAVVVFLDASLWFLQGNFSTNTVYEARGSFAKPPEVLFLALLIRMVLLQNLPGVVPGGMKKLALVWIMVIIAGGFSALLLGRTPADILVFSEMRSPILMVLFTLMLAPLFRVSPRFFVDTFSVFVLLHFAISLLSWQTGVSLLWRSFAPNYAGGHAAFFGADESVMVYLLALTLSLALAISTPDTDISGMSRKFWALVLALTSFAILASLRRGGVGTAAIIGMVFFSFSGTNTKTRLLIIAGLLAPIVFGVAGQAGVLSALFDRLSGLGTVATSDAGRLSDFLQAKSYISQHFWLGTGAGTKLALARTQAYGVSEALSIHNAVLHVWVRFGIAGAMAYVLLFLIPIATALRLTGERRKACSDAALHLQIAMAGLLLGMFLWTLSTPAVFLNFRQAAVWAIAVAAIFGTRFASAPDPRVARGKSRLPRKRQT